MRSARSTDLPAPVGPTIKVCPTSPTWVDRRKGVAPSVFVNIKGGAFKCPFFAGPAHTADKGNRCDKFKVETRGFRTFAYTWPGIEESQASIALKVSFTVTKPRPPKIRSMALRLSCT